MRQSKTTQPKHLPLVWRAEGRLLFLAFFFLLVTIRPCTADQNHLSSLQSSILALDSARQTAVQELGELALSAPEKTDYKDFLVYLNTRIVNYCMELAQQAGSAALEDLPCPSFQATARAVASPSPAQKGSRPDPGATPSSTRTRAEKTADMDGGFLAALAEFDEMLLREEEKISARVPSQRETGSASTTGASRTSGASGESGEAGDSTSIPSRPKTAGEQQAETLSDGQQATGTGDANIDHSKYGAPGGKLPPPSDDDIVARQLREAAEKETDPELKKKLWEEYWKYKGVKRGTSSDQ